MTTVISQEEFETSKTNVIQSNLVSMGALVRHSDELDLKDPVHIEVHFTLAAKVQELAAGVERLQDMDYKQYLALWEGAE